MTWEFIRQGDAEAAIVDILDNYTPELIPFDTPSKPLSIKTTLVGYQMGDRWIEVSLEGGADNWPKIWKPRIDFEVHAETRTVAHDMAQVAKASIQRAMGFYSGKGINLCDAKTEQGLTRVPDKLGETPRYIFSLRLTVTPNNTPYS